jgi:hypothetical protein
MSVNNRHPLSRGAGFGCLPTQQKTGHCKGTAWPQLLGDHVRRSLLDAEKKAHGTTRWRTSTKVGAGCSCGERLEM